MAIKYQLFYQEEVLRKDIPSLSSSAKILIKRAIEERLAINPIVFGKPLRYSLSGYRSLRVGDYRVIYRIDTDANTITIVSIKHRKDAYD